jgi:predicted ABC-type ATPase
MNAAAPAPVCRIISGPNGSGKTTFALKYLPEVAPGTAFVNADLIAAGLSPLAPEQQLLAASRLFLQQIEQHVAEGRDFAFETTWGYLRLVRRLRSAGWRVELFYLALPNVEMSRKRVAERVAHAVDHARCLLNSGPLPEIVFVQDGDKRMIFSQTV